MITGDPCDPIVQVRLIIGDTDSRWIGSDEVIQYYLSLNNDDIYAAAIACLKAIKAHISTEMSHAVGDVWIDFNKKFDVISQQLDDLINDPNSLKDLGIYIGGVSKAEIARVRNRDDFRGSPLGVGFYTDEDTETWQ